MRKGKQNKDLIHQLISKEEDIFPSLQFLQSEELNEHAPALRNYSPWNKIPMLAVITGKNGNSKTQLLRYIYKILLQPNINNEELKVLFYYNKRIDIPSSSINVHYFIPRSEPRNQLIEDIRQYCKDKSKKKKDLKYFYENNNIILYSKLKRMIDSGEIDNNTDVENWEEKVEYIIDSNLDYDKNIHDPENPVNTLISVFEIHSEGIRLLKQKYRDFSYFNILCKFFFKIRRSNP